jgi:hypothetical protein
MSAANYGRNVNAMCTVKDAANQGTSNDTIVLGMSGGRLMHRVKSGAA